MNWIDLVFFAIILASVIYSFTRGMIRELFALLALAAGVFLGLKAAPAGVQALSPQLASPMVAAMVAFIVTFLIAGLILLFIGSVLAHSAQALQLGWLDRILGAVFGFAKGVLLVSVIVFLIAAFQSPRSTFIQRSRVAATVSSLSSRACRMLPPDIAATLQERLNGIRNGATAGAHVEALATPHRAGGSER